MITTTTKLIETALMFILRRDVFVSIEHDRPWKWFIHIKGEEGGVDFVGLGQYRIEYGG